MRSRRLLRSPAPFWLAAAAMALLTATAVGRLTARHEALAARYGPLRPVVVAAHRLEAGAELDAGRVARRLLPASFVPDGALAAPEEAAGRVALTPLEAGQLLLRAHLAPEGVRGLAALLPPGTRAVAVPAGPSSPALAPGDTVDVLATFDPSPAGGDPTVLVAAGARVLAVGADSATVAVDPAAARLVAYAVAAGSVTMVVAPPPGPGPAQRSPAATTPRTATPTSTR